MTTAEVLRTSKIVLDLEASMKKQMERFEPPNSRELHIRLADLSNFFLPAQRPYQGVARISVARVWHSAEEGADQNEVTPRWFQDPRANASTEFYLDSDGDIYYMVPTWCFCWAQGVRFETEPINAVEPYPAWFDRARMVSYNTCAHSYEIENYARLLHTSWNEGSPQFEAGAALAGFHAAVDDVPLDGAFDVAHSELCTTKGDPGPHWHRLKPALMARADEYRVKYTRTQAKLPMTMHATDDASEPLADLRKKLNSFATQLNSLQNTNASQALRQVEHTAAIATIQETIEAQAEQIVGNAASLKEDIETIEHLQAASVTHARAIGHIEHDIERHTHRIETHCSPPSLAREATDEGRARGTPMIVSAPGTSDPRT